MPRSIGSSLYEWQRRFRRKAFTVLVRGGFRSFGAGSSLEPPCKLLGTEHISIGRNVYVGPNSWLTFLAGASGPKAGPDVGISLGDGVCIAGDCVVSAIQRIVFEDNVLVGRHVHISDHAHRTDDPSMPISAQGLTEPAPVRIRAGAWLGHGAVICPGVTIGQNSVIGANSVVKTDVPDGCLAVGAPAVVKRRLGSRSAN